MRSSVRVAVSALVAGAAVAYAAPASAWTVAQVPVASTGFFGGFNDVTSVSASDGWAVGGNTNGIIERYNGTRWSVVPSPDLLTGGNTWATLSGVDSVGSTTAFAVGRTTGSSSSAAVALRWNGSAWSRLTVNRPAGANTSFTAVKAFSASDVWAVGTTSTSSVAMTLAMHYSGSGWTTPSTPSPGTRNNWVTAVDGTATNDVW